MSEAMYIASVVGTYWVVSISMVYLNKMLMSDGLSVPAPLFVTWYQSVVTVLICWMAGQCGQRARSSSATQYTPVSVNDDGASMPANPPRPSFFAQFPKAEYVLAQARQIFPLSLVFVGMITFNNLCLKYVEVSFYNVARSLTIVFNVFFSRIFLGIPTSCKTMLCLLIVISGFVMGTHGEINFSLVGTVSGVMSSVFVSLNSIFTKKVLPVVDDNHWKLTFYNNVNAAFLFIPLIVYFEADIIKNSNGKLTSAAFWSAMSVAGFFGFSIGIVTVLQIKATSPLTHNISGTAKAAVQSLMAFYLWGNEWTIMGVLGIFTVLGGSLLYTFVRMSENAQNAPPPRHPQQEMSSKV
mmetsp:Transcript_19486/g.41708  ORF Transcript_19486/g.41708 Transcript_19486/m.41708 type:complete len:353 (-) Transcript_19486:439-1497(-)|eukprot:CAMPEP_0172528430 /NCGR_PEP_ID=MMETSP1067-20121228/2826_1 /TAXON_ID=265564 ORGANISM="Thalassiosira punctigera, Strain Tpunct2005C2" /NCGR_SAMPLE_ID=MMETSP1067 /ASSEMBLY_ACC=CAM_ASM_000444 /LENGTH=352 /DNA_ID=CAMNT_0013312333 /DNA_START=195 /DNA_END=1253 /DNA_ORIENTATION=+